MEKKKNGFWFGVAMLLLGAVIGFLVSPVKKGVNVKNICGNTNMDEDELMRLEGCEYEEVDPDSLEDMPF